MIDGLAAHMQDLGLSQPEAAARKMMSSILRRDALVMAFSDCYTYLAIGFAFAALVSLSAKPTRLSNVPVAVDVSKSTQAVE